MKTLTAVALALGLPAISPAQPTMVNIPAATHDWGCEVLLCLANPAGPTAVAECVPPIRRLWRALARGRSFPTCSMASGSNGRSYAQPAHSYYDRCPQGTTELAVGQLAELIAPMNGSIAASPSGMPSTYSAAIVGRSYTGIGSGAGYGEPSADTPPPTKVCVAGNRGTRDVWQGDVHSTVNLFDTVFVSAAQPSPRTVDIYVDDIFWHSVRW
ncbi:hypothetical protein RHDC3_00752 [Rhodocyclaceae bacterium]|nr:hypothetical protein RHDC3_00752 [Rhodocyclaceae bacterium]